MDESQRGIELMIKSQVDEVCMYTQYSYLTYVVLVGTGTWYIYYRVWCLA
jgi:hypothetical protein